MNLDIRSLILVLGITHVIQFVVFAHQYSINRAFRGVGWWLMWSAAEVVAFSVMFLRDIPGILPLVVMLQNALLMAGVVFLYVGILRFFGRRENRARLGAAFGIYLAALLYFLFVRDDAILRGVVISAAMTVLSLVTAHALLAHRPHAVAATARFLAVTFVINGVFFAVRGGLILASDAPFDFFAPTVLTGLLFLNGVLMSLVWTFGSIIMINQRLNADVTEAKETLERVFNTSPDAVLLTRLDDGQIVKVNDGFVALTGHAREEAVGRSTLDVNLWNRASDRGEYVRRLVERGSFDNQEAEIRRRDGSTFHGLISGQIIMLHDQPHVISVARDITGRKRDEEERAALESQASRLQKAESLGRMAGAIAHHFNNQLQAVIGNVELALEDLGPDAEARPPLREALQAARRASEVSGLMLTYVGKPLINREPMDLAAACRRELPLLKAAMPVQVVLETDLPAPGPVVSANRDQIQQVLANLFTNAWESFGAQGGRLRLAVRTATPAEIPVRRRFPEGWQAGADAYACLEVADEGCGMRAAELENIFEPFFSTKFTGRGLGLAVVLGIVRAHEGVVTVESLQGRGSTFRVFLPVTVAPLSGAGEPPAVPELQAGGLVLLVDDETSVRTAGAKMLEQLGFTVREASDGPEALDLFRRHRDDVRCVVCDLTMPQMSGWDLLARLRTLRPGVPVILASGYDKAHAMAGEHPEWPQVFLGKPYTRQQLRDALAQALAGRT